MRCPLCGAAELIHDTRDLPYTYKGETTFIPAVTGDFCPACAESILDAAESDRVMQEMRARPMNIPFLKIKLICSQPHGLGDFIQACPARLGAVFHLGVGTLGHPGPGR